MRTLPYCGYHEFLAIQENQSLLEFACNNQQYFGTAGVTDVSENDNHWRNAKVLYSYQFPELKEIFKLKLLSNYSRVCQELGMTAEATIDVDVQMTVHHDGDFFKAHYDSGTEDTNDRVLTFVYYFHKEPKAFSGGELIIHEPSTVTIEPVNNMIVFFDPMQRHEVSIVNCKDNNFVDGRFTLNGWIIKKEQ
jgi:Rps23 Pro-64 3,4-dihydroxylase Tpa1-like proline 4-hydroxylase